MGSSNFNRQQSINDYISLIQLRGSITGSDAEELTAHLYDATDALRDQGLSEEEAFIIACKRLGNETTLTEEYRKVNTSLKTNKIWVYLFVGFNFFYALPALVFTATAALYDLVYENFHTSVLSAVIVSIFHLLFIMLVWYVVSNKRRISNFIEKQIELNSVRFVCISFIPQLINAIPIPSFTKNEAAQAFLYPVRGFDSSFSEFSFYIALMSIIAGALSLIFSVNKAENLTPRILFQKPSMFFLFLFGIIIELLAASTRALHIESIIGSTVFFGSVYLIASFSIAFYNNKSSINRYLMIAMLFGLTMEITVGFIADRDRGNTFYTVYFVSGMLLGILSGRYLGLKLQDRNLHLESAAS